MSGFGRVEDVALDVVAAAEHEARGDRLWRARQYVEAFAEYAAAEAAHDCARAAACGHCGAPLAEGARSCDACGGRTEP